MAFVVIGGNYTLSGTETYSGLSPSVGDVVKSYVNGSLTFSTTITTAGYYGVQFLTSEPNETLVDLTIQPNGLDIELFAYSYAPNQPIVEDIFSGNPPQVITLNFQFNVGCTDPTACNYDEDATIDGDNCYYTDCEECENPPLGDINQDCEIDVLDVVQTVEVVLQDSLPTEEQLMMSDMNGDGSIDVLDIVLLVGIILGRFLMRF